MSEPNRSIKIAFIGGGNMARSIIGGLIASGQDPMGITVSDPVRDQRILLEKKFGINCVENNSDCSRDADLIVLAVKPQMMKEAVCSISGVLAQNGALVVSIAAGIRIESILRWAGSEVPVVRVMPNTPSLINCGVSGLYATPATSDANRTLAANLISSTGPVVWVQEETDIDTVTGISGSGPAYYFKLMEIMIDSACRNGLAPDAARTLVLQTALGAARLALASEEEPRELRKQVTSPGGTTEAALAAMESAGIDVAVASGISAAIDKSGELADALGGN